MYIHMYYIGRLSGHLSSDTGFVVHVLFAFVCLHLNTLVCMSDVSCPMVPIGWVAAYGYLHNTYPRYLGRLKLYSLGSRLGTDSILSRGPWARRGRNFLPFMLDLKQVDVSFHVPRRFD